MVWKIVVWTNLYSIENTLVLNFDKAILKKNRIDNIDIIINVINSVISLKRL